LATGAASFNIKGTMSVKSHNDIQIEDLFTGDRAALNASASVMAPLTFLLGNDFELVDIQGVDLTIDSTEQPRTATIERVWVDGVHAKAGKTLPLKVLMRTYRGEEVVRTVPVAIPGLVIGVAYLWAWIGIPGGLYGTIWILALAFIARFMPDTVKALSTSFLQIHRELEEAAWVCGKGVLGTVRTIVLPLARPGVIAAMTLLFVLSIRELGSSLFLYTSNTMVMSVLLLDYYEGGNVGKTAAFSLVQTVLLGVLIGGANWLARSAAQGNIAQRIR